MSNVQITKDAVGNESVIDLDDVQAMMLTQYGDLTIVFPGGGLFVMGEKWGDRKALFEKFRASKGTGANRLITPSAHDPKTDAVVGGADKVVNVEGDRVPADVQKPLASLATPTATAVTAKPAAK